MTLMMWDIKDLVFLGAQCKESELAQYIQTYELFVLTNMNMKNVNNYR